jgi:phosphopantetheinyl transferase (holo-ACP synthase)
MKENENKLKDVFSEIDYKGNSYKLFFNLNVMEEIQEKYGTFDNWTDLVSGKDKTKEVNIKALKFGFKAMLNEGIEIKNDDEGTEIPLFTEKQVGRMITEIGLQTANQKLMDTVVESTKSTEKNA